ncbi:hypothetical protein MG295_00218 [Bacillus phage vB_BcgM]|nr:hypothetical protein MG295_00218 [Bacillus phage vB_BcgM]
MKLRKDSIVFGLFGISFGILGWVLQFTSYPPVSSWLCYYGGILLGIGGIVNNFVKTYQRSDKNGSKRN